MVTLDWANRNVLVTGVEGFDYINGGYFVFFTSVSSTIWKTTMYWDANLCIGLRPRGELAAYKHDGFKEFEELNGFWETGVMPTIGYKGKPPWLRSPP